MSGPFQWVLGLLTVAGVVLVLRFVKRNETRLEELAMRSEKYEQNHA
jgi:hypothetical protein